MSFTLKSHIALSWMKTPLCSSYCIPDTWEMIVLFIFLKSIHPSFFFYISLVLMMDAEARDILNWSPYDRRAKCSQTITPWRSFGKKKCYSNRRENATVLFWVWFYRCSIIQNDWIEFASVSGCERDVDCTREILCVNHWQGWWTPLTFKTSESVPAHTHTHRQIAAFDANKVTEWERMQGCPCTYSFVLYFFAPNHFGFCLYCWLKLILSHHYFCLPSFIPHFWSPPPPPTLPLYPYPLLPLTL